MADTEYTPREVIENKLLAALDDESKVAILCTKDDLDVLITALELTRDVGREAWSNKLETYLLDLKQLRKSAFSG